VKKFLSMKFDRILVFLGFALGSRMSNSVPTPKQYLIEGVTHAGKAFRPSDWAERLCGVMSSFQPPGRRVVGAPMQYSPYVHPVMVGQVKCVAVDERLGQLEPMAMEFVRSFARDNDLPFVEACVIPEPPSPAK
jgi:hypothetical protein